MTVGATNGVNPYGTIQRHSATMRRPINNGFATLEQHPHNTLRYKVKCIRINGSLIIKYSGTILKRACFENSKYCILRLCLLFSSIGIKKVYTDAKKRV